MLTSRRALHGRLLALARARRLVCNLPQHPEEGGRAVGAVFEHLQRACGCQGLPRVHQVCGQTHGPGDYPQPVGQAPLPRAPGVLQCEAVRSWHACGSQLSLSCFRNHTSRLQHQGAGALRIVHNCMHRHICLDCSAQKCAERKVLWLRCSRQSCCLRRGGWVLGAGHEAGVGELFQV